MKRRIVWLALPLVLGALMLGVKWRVEHPKPTKEDLEMRAFILKSTEAQLIHSSWDGAHRFRADYESKIAIRDLTPLIAEIHLIPLMRDADFMRSRAKSGRIRITFLRSDITAYRASFFSIWIWILTKESSFTTETLGIQSGLLY